MALGTNTNPTTGSDKETQPDTRGRSANCLRFIKLFLQRLTSWRLRTMFFLHFAIAISFMLRNAMPIALICMMQTSSRNFSNMEPDLALLSFASVSSNNFVSSNETTVQSHPAYTKAGEFQWDSFTQGLILSSGNALVFVMPMMTHYLSQSLGCKCLMQMTMLLLAILTLLQPVAVRVSPYIFVLLRLGVGLLGGTSVPLANEVMAWWTPEKEKVTLASFVFAGITVASVLVGIPSVYICTVPIDNGWPFIFYGHGIFALIWCALWQLFGSGRPDDHPFISEHEKNYIATTRLGMNKNQTDTRPPYKIILKSGPVWMYIFVGTAHMFGILTVATYVPLFLTTVLGLTVEMVGTFVSAGYMARCLGAIMYGHLSNLLMSTTDIGKTACRKVIQCSALYLTTASFVILGFTEDTGTAICLLVFIMIFQSSSMASGLIVPLDIAPRYAGVLNGIMLTLSSIVCMPWPVIVSTMTTNGTLAEFRNVFTVVAIVLCAGSTSFLVWGSAELQSWAIPAVVSTIQAKEKSLASDSIAPSVIAVPPMAPASLEMDERHSTSLSSPPATVYIGNDVNHGHDNPGFCNDSEIIADKNESTHL